MIEHKERTSTGRRRNAETGQWEDTTHVIPSYFQEQPFGKRTEIKRLRKQERTARRINRGK